MSEIEKKMLEAMVKAEADYYIEAEGKYLSQMIAKACSEVAINLAREQSIAFIKWADVNKWHFDQIYEKSHTFEELFDLFLSETKYPQRTNP